MTEFDEILQYVKILNNNLKEFDDFLVLKPQRTYQSMYEFMITSNRKYNLNLIVSLLDGHGWIIDSDWGWINSCFYLTISKCNLHRNMRIYYLKELSS